MQGSTTLGSVRSARQTVVLKRPHSCRKDGTLLEMFDFSSAPRFDLGSPGLGHLSPEKIGLVVFWAPRRREEDFALTNKKRPGPLRIVRREVRGQ